MEKAAHVVSMRRALKQEMAKNPFLQVSELIYRLFCEKIITLEWKPGTQINETLFSKELEVSRSPIQAAVLRLEAEGLVVKEKGKMVQVGPMDFEEYLRIGQFRRAVEGEAAYLAAKSITDVQLGKLKNYIENDLKACASSAGPVRTSTDQARDAIEFHRIIVNASGNQYLIKAFGLYAARMIRYMSYMGTRTTFINRNPGFSVNQHIAVYNALKARYSDAAKNEIVGDINSMIHALHGFPEKIS